MNTEFEAQELNVAVVEGIAQLTAAAAQLQRSASAVEARLGGGYGVATAVPASGEVARLVAAIEPEAARRMDELEARLRIAEQQIAELRANSTTSLAAVAGRKTLPAVASHLLAKHGLENLEQINGGVLDAALTGLSLEQRIAVKSQLLRAGLLS